MRILFFTITCFMMSQFSWAQTQTGYGFYFEETFFPVYVNKNDTTSVTGSRVADESGLGFNTKTTLGYLFWGQALVFGLTYNHYSLTTKRNNVSGGDPGLKESTTETLWGPTLGWLYGRFRILFTHFMAGEKSVNSRNFNASGTTGHTIITNTDLTGYQVTLGYSFAIWGVEIGPSLVYTVRSYAKQSKKDKMDSFNDYKNFKLVSPYKNTELEPMLSFVVKF